MTTQSELERLTNEVKRLQMDCQKLENEYKAASNNNPDGDKLGIFKQ